MFDIGFTEIALLSIVALLVVGPERLPAMVRTVGLWVGRIRRYANTVRQDIERELHAEELRELSRESGKIGGELGGLKSAVDETREALSDVSRSFKDAAREAETELESENRSVQGAGLAEDADAAVDDPPHVQDAPGQQRPARRSADDRQEELALDVDHGDEAPSGSRDVSGATSEQR